MESAFDAWPETTRIISLADKPIKEVEVIKTLDDPVFGQVFLGSFTYEGNLETNYTYIKRLDDSNNIPQDEMWRLIKSCKRHPEKGYIPKLIAYSTHTEELRGYLDILGPKDHLRNYLEADEANSRDERMLNFNPGRIRELYFEPFPENLKTLIHKRGRDHLPFSEQELMLFLTSSIKVVPQ
jgi:hypothetical protein